MIAVRPSERGAALLTVLLLVAVMAVLAASALEQLKFGTRLAVNSAATEQARAYAMAAETVAKFRIGDLIQSNSAKTTLVGNWASTPTNFPIDGGTATARLEDGGNCFNLNSLVDRGQDGIFTARPAALIQLSRLLSLLDVPARDASAIAAATADWIDSDDQPSPGGAEDIAYAGARVAYRTSGAPFADSSEWRAVVGMTPQLYARMRPLVCALPVTDQTMLNINTLRPDQAPILAAMVGIDPERARSAIGKRPPLGWDSVADFWTLPQMSGVAPGNDTSGQVKLTTRWFTLHLNIALADAEFEEAALIDAVQRPAKLVRRSYGDAS